MSTNNKFQIFAPIAKIDKEKRIVYGFATTEDIDKAGEVVKYDGSKRAFAKWKGNIREMHQPIAVGKAVEIMFDDEKKGIWVGAYVSKGAQDTWEKCLDGTLTGYSIGGEVLERQIETMKVDGKNKSIPCITEYDLKELSLVDNPCNGSCDFAIVKSIDGSDELHLTDIVIGQQGDKETSVKKGEMAESPEMTDEEKAKRFSFSHKWQCVELTATLETLQRVLADTIYNILFDVDLSKEEKVQKVQTALDEFQTIVSEKLPDCAEYFSRCVTSVLTGELLNKLNEIGGKDLVEKVTETKTEETTPTPAAEAPKAEAPKAEETPKVEETPKAEPTETPKTEEAPKPEEKKEEPKAEETPKVEEKVDTPKEDPLEKRISALEGKLNEIAELLKSLKQPEGTEKIDSLKTNLEALSKRFNEFMGEPAPRKESKVIEKKLATDETVPTATKKEEAKPEDEHDKLVKTLVAKRLACQYLTPEEDAILLEEFNTRMNKRFGQKK